MHDDDMISCVQILKRHLILCSLPLACTEIQIDGDSITSGPIEVCYNGKWGSVCDDYWTDHDANVACGQLGLLNFGE